MNEDDLDFLRGVVPTIVAAYPPSPRIKTFGEWTVVRLHRATLSHYLGVVKLVEHRLGVEAMILLRSLYWDTVRLGYLALDPAQLQERSLKLAYRSVKDELNLEREASRIFVGNPEKTLIADLEKELDDLRSQLVAMGVTRIRRLPDEKDMARHIGAASRRPLMDFLSQLAHGGERSRSVTTEHWTASDGESRASLHVQTDPSETMLVGLAGAAAFIEATRAKASLLGWETVDSLACTLAVEIAEYIREVESRESRE